MKIFCKDIVITNKVGLHARPATLFVKEASKFKSDIKVVKNEKEYNAKSIIGILSLGAVNGDKITIKAEGDDSERAVKSLVNLVRNNFNG